MRVDPIKFYFIKPGAHGSLNDDLKTITEQLGTYENSLGITTDHNSLTISYPDTNIKATLSSNQNSNLNDIAISSQMTLTCDPKDNVSVNLLKGIVKSMGYRVYNPSFGSFSTVDPNLMDLTTAQLNAKIIKIFEHNRLIPLFQYINSLIFYAKDPTDDSIHLVNRHLLQSALELSVDDSKDHDDFSVKIAPDIAVFIALADRGVIPTSFYHKLYSGDKDVYHHNLSGLDLTNVETDIYLSPVFFQLDRATQSFVSLSKTKPINVFKKIDQGESLKSFISQTVVQHNIEPLLAVRYPNSIQFMTENTGRVVPRINTSIFVGPQ